MPLSLSQWFQESKESIFLDSGLSSLNSEMSF